MKNYLLLPCMLLFARTAMIKAENSEYVEVDFENFITIHNDQTKNLKIQKEKRTDDIHVFRVCDEALVLRKSLIYIKASESMLVCKDEGWIYVEQKEHTVESIKNSACAEHYSLLNEYLNKDIKN